MTRLLLRPDGIERLDQALLRALRDQGLAVSRSRLKELFVSEGVRVAGRPRSASWIPPRGASEAEIAKDLSEFLDPGGSPARASGRGPFLPVIYEDDSILALHKLSGVPSLPHQASETETAVGAALARFPGLPRFPGRPLEPGLLHRLDTGTSGILVFAKTPAEYQRLRQAWRANLVRKIYRARISSPDARPLPEAPRTVRLDLAHDPDSSRRMIAVCEAGHRRFRGKPLPTVTHLRGIAPTADPAVFDAEIEIETGVMHQIRCTLRWLGWPVLGDPIYRGAPSGRLWLHSWRLVLPLPNGSTLTLQSMLPTEYLMHSIDPGRLIK